MTTNENKRFYENDLEKYQIKKNKFFRNWLNFITKNGYKTYAKLDDYQNLIDSVASWYEIKYPNREMDIEYGVIDRDFYSSLTNTGLSELFFRLSNISLDIIKAHYRANCGGYIPKRDNDGYLIPSEPYIAFDIYQKISSDDLYNRKMIPIGIRANAKSGIILENDLLEEFFNDKKIGFYDLIKNKEIDINSLYAILDSYHNEFDLKELIEIIYLNDCDVKIRKYLLEMAALKLLYSKNTIPEYGYERALRLIYEFNNEMDLHLQSREIDSLIQRKNDGKEKSLKKTKFYS